MEKVADSNVIGEGKVPKEEKINLLDKTEVDR